MKLRIDKYLADMGLGTRSEIKEYIKRGTVSINGTVVKSPKEKADTDCDNVFCGGELVEYLQYEYYVINKPAGVISATEDPHTKTVVDLIEGARKDVFPVGRLDKDTEGLLLITNDGMLAHNLLSPGKHVDKKYYVEVSGKLTEEHIRLMEEGLRVDGNFKALPAALEIIDSDENSSRCNIIIHEGKFHQIKRMMEAVGCSVTYLKRLSMGKLELPENLKPGEYYKLSATEIKCLFGEAAE